MTYIKANLMATRWAKFFCVIFACSLAIHHIHPAPAFGQNAGVPPQQVSGNEISSLIRSTMLAIDHANQTGNYTVLHGLGSSAFRQAGSPADLGDLFRNMRKQKVDLRETVLLDPKIIGAPGLTTDGRLTLKGFFETKPDYITFDLVFFFESGLWQIASLSLGTQPIPAQQNQALQNATPQPTPENNSRIDIPNSAQQDSSRGAQIPVPAKRP